MNRKVKTSRLFIVLLVGTALMTSCGNSNPAKTSMDSTSAAGPAPDNNSAGNGSSADTNYQKDTGRKIIDSTRH